MKKEKEILVISRKDIRLASFCSGFSWLLLIASIVLFFVMDEYKFVFTGSAISAGIIMFYGMKVLRNKCCCPGCRQGNMGTAKDREYIASLSARADFVVCPGCKKKIFIR